MVTSHSPKTICCFLLHCLEHTSRHYWTALHTFPAPECCSGRETFCSSQKSPKTTEGETNAWVALLQFQPASECKCTRLQSRPAWLSSPQICDSQKPGNIILIIGDSQKHEGGLVTRQQENRTKGQEPHKGKKTEGIGKSTLHLATCILSKDT